MVIRTNEKITVFITFLLTCAALALAAGSLGTNYWIVSEAVRKPDGETLSEKSHGVVNFGLFHGTRRLNTGFGERVYGINVLETQYREQQFMVKELYVTTISLLCGGLAFGLIASVLSLINTASNPYEAVCHFPGLITVNTMAFLFSFASLITWVAQFFLRFRTNALIREDVVNGKWSSEGLAGVGFSFWMLFAAAGLYLINAGIIFVLHKRRNRLEGEKNYVIEAAQKPNGNLMLY